MHEIETSLALWCQIVQHLNTVLCWQCVTHYGPSRAPTRVESHLISLYAHTLSIVLCSPLPFLPSLTTHSVVLLHHGHHHYLTRSYLLRFGLALHTAHRHHRVADTKPPLPPPPPRPPPSSSNYFAMPSLLLLQQPRQQPLLHVDEPSLKNLASLTSTRNSLQATSKDFLQALGYVRCTRGPFFVRTPKKLPFMLTLFLFPNMLTHIDCKYDYTS